MVPKFHKVLWPKHLRDKMQAYCDAWVTATTSGIGLFPPREAIDQMRTFVVVKVKRRRMIAVPARPTLAVPPVPPPV